MLFERIAKIYKSFSKVKPTVNLLEKEKEQEHNPINLFHKGDYQEILYWINEGESNSPSAIKRRCGDVGSIDYVYQK